MILVERREAIESMLKEIVSVLDFEVYEPLMQFMSGSSHTSFLISNVNIIANIMRGLVAKKRLNNRLFRFYSQELLNFMYTMVSGYLMCMFLSFRIFVSWFLSLMFC
jgi:uncharacterized membrane protein